jgi:succinyl-diaminopimelate desuccinylase
MDVDLFLATAAELLAVPSTADRPAELHRALEMVIRFAGPGFTAERFESGGKPSALLYRGAGRPHFRIILNGHLDVVPAGPEQFRPRREDGRLYARGAQDMKVSALVLTQVFRELASHLPYPLGLQLVTDEEVGGRDGTLYQLEQGVSGEFAVIGEASGLRLVTDSKGRINARLRAGGRSAHGAYPWLGDNALVKLHRSLDRVLAAYPVPAEEAWRTTVNLARIETANQAFNQIPDHAEAWLDIRFPADDPDLNGKSFAEIAAHLAGFCEPGVTPAVDSADPARHANPDRPEMRRLREAITRQGYRPDLLRKHGASDGRFYYQQGIDAVIFGIGGDGQHGPAEYADIPTIAPYYRALTDFLCDPGPAGPVTAAGLHLGQQFRLLALELLLPERTAVAQLGPARFGHRRAVVAFTGLRPAADKRDDLGYLAGLAAAGALTPVIEATYPLARIADAHRRVEAGHKRGNVVVTMTDDEA